MKHNSSRQHGYTVHYRQTILQHLGLLMYKHYTVREHFQIFKEHSSLFQFLILIYLLSKHIWILTVHFRFWQFTGIKCVCLLSEMIKTTQAVIAAPLCKPEPIKNVYFKNPELHIKLPKHDYNDCIINLWYGATDHFEAKKSLIRISKSYFYNRLRHDT